MSWSLSVFPRNQHDEAKDLTFKEQNFKRKMRNFEKNILIIEKWQFLNKTTEALGAWNTFDNLSTSEF